MLFFRNSAIDSSLPNVDDLLNKDSLASGPRAPDYPAQVKEPIPEGAEEEIAEEAVEEPALATPVVKAPPRRPQAVAKDRDALGSKAEAAVAAATKVSIAKPKHHAKPEYKYEENSSDEVFEKAVRRLIELLPSNGHVRRALLAELTESSEELLHELSTRVRAFKSLFEAWEAVHLVPSYGSLVQQNVVQRLRGLKDTTLDIGAAIKGYDEFRSFMNTFEKRLFSGTLDYHGNHMALHTSFYNGGKGIVFTAGDGQAGFLLASIPLFRKLGFAYPIEIMYLGEEDLSEERREDLEALPGVVTRDLSKMINDEGWKLRGMHTELLQYPAHANHSSRMGRQTLRHSHVLLPRSHLHRRRCPLLRKPRRAV
jgi:hypothetical protein